MKKRKNKKNKNILLLNYFKPSIYIQSYKSLNLNSLKSNGIKLILCDMDNTLISFGERLPSIDVINFVNSVKKMGIEFVLFSNNLKSRVENFAKKAGIENYFWDCRKPLIGKMKIIDNLFNFNRDEIIFIGDQLITDILFANRCHIKSILVTPLKRSEEQNKFVKFLENKILKVLEQKNIIHEGFYSDSEISDSYEIL